MTDNYDDLLDTKQAAEILGISVGRVRQLAQSGRLHGRHVGRDWVFDHDAIQQFAATPRLKPGRPAGNNLLKAALQEAHIRIAELESFLSAYEDRPEEAAPPAPQEEPTP